MVKDIDIAQNTPSITVFNDPLSKVRYLETILDGKDWRSQIIFPKDDPKSLETLEETRNNLTARGYKIDEQKNNDGHSILNIRHYGAGTEIRELLKDKGLAQGIGYSITHPNIPMQQLVNTSRGVLNEMGNFFKNPASANGLIFVSAEIFLTAAGLGNKSASGKKETFVQRMKQPRNYLQSLAGALFLSQSIVYMLFAKDNEQQAMEKLNKKTDQLEQDGKQNFGIKFNVEKDGPKDDVASKFGRFLQRNPVQIGAMFNNVGMLVYMGHAVFNRRFHTTQLNGGIQKAATKLGKSMEQVDDVAKQIATARKGTGLFKNKATRKTNKAALETLEGQDKKLFGLAEDLNDAREYTEGGIWKSGFARDIGGALTSLVAWSLLLLPSKKKTDVEKQTDKENAQGNGVISRISQRLKDDPEIGTGLLALTSSSQRLLGSLSKRNFLQTVGETIYIPGDILLMFTKNSEYSGGHANTDKLSKHVAADLNSQAWLLGPSAQRTLAKDTATFIRDRAIADMQIDKNAEPLTPQQLAAQTLKLENAVFRRVAYTQSERFDELVDSTATLLQRFPKGLRANATEQIVQTMSAQPWMHVTPEELRNALSITLSARTIEEPPIKHIQELAEELKNLIGKGPDKEQSNFAIQLHECVSNVAKAPKSEAPQPQIHSAELNPERLVARVEQQQLATQG